MPRPFLEKIKDPNYWLEQAAHGWIGYAAAFPAGALVYWFTRSGWWAFWAGIASAALVGAVREVAQNVGDDDNDVADAILDTAMTILGGVLISLLWLFVWLVSRNPGDQ